MNDLDYALTCSNRLAIHSAYVKVDYPDTAIIKQAWEEFIYWLDLWYADRKKRGLPVVAGYIPMCQMIAKELGI